MSVESGIPPFRGPGGLWTKYGEPPMNGYQIFLADPKKAWEDRISRQNDELWGPLKVAKPNAGPYGAGRAGGDRSVAFSDHAERRRSASSGRPSCNGGDSRQLETDSLHRMRYALRFRGDRPETLPPPAPKCEGLLKSDTVSFGEPIPPDVLNSCIEHSARADLVIVAGTSATVYPAAGFALEVKQRGGALIEANLYDSEITPICDISLTGPTGEVLPRLRAISRISKMRSFPKARLS